MGKREEKREESNNDVEDYEEHHSTSKQLRLAFLLSVYQVVNDFNHFLLYLLFAETTYGCDFETIFGIYYGIGAGAQLVAKFCSGPIADAAGTPHRVLRVLYWSIAVQLGVQLLMFLGHWSDAWIIIYLQVVLWGSTLLAQNLIWKLMKQHVEHAMPGDVSAQTHIINRLQSIGIFLSTSVLAMSTFTAYWLGNHVGLPFDTVKWFMFGVSLVATVVTGLLAVSLSDDFIASDPALRDKSAGSSTASSPGQDLAPLIGITTSYGIAGDSNQTDNVLADSGWAYFKRGMLGMYQDSIVFYAIILFSLSFLYQYMIYVTATLDLSAQQSTETKTLANFCGGSVTYLFLQAFALNVVYIIGATAYGVVVARLSPKQAFSFVIPALGVLLGLLTAVLFKKMSGLESSFVLAVLSFLSYSVYLYCQNLGMATVPEDMVGLFNSLVGTIGSVLLLLPSAFTALHIPFVIALIFCCALMASLVLVSMVLVARHARKLDAISV